MTDSEKEQRIDAFLSGWGGLKESREYAKFYLEQCNWDVRSAQDLYWRENILIY
jgi:hypothetical protein